MSKLSIYNIDIDRLNQRQAVDQILAWIADKSFECKYVVTPNLDHVVKLNTNIAFRNAYQKASLVLADGWPVVLTSKLIGASLPGTVTGSDLVPAIFQVATENEQPITIYLLGAGTGVAEKAARIIEGKWPFVKVVGLYSPPFGFEKDITECAEICQRINTVKPDLLVLGLGAPKQELWIQQYAANLQTGVALCVGATIDFLAGEKKRAPMWIQKLKLEWMHRMLSEPKRLAKRYAHDALVFPFLLLREILKYKRHNK